MKLTTVLFDLDGTLLPMDNDEFTKAYFKLLCKKAAPFGYEPQKLIDSVWKGTAAMVANDGSITNCEAFWNKFEEIYGTEALKDKEMFDGFYRNEFNGAKELCGFNDKLVSLVKEIRSLGLRTALATNPIFPAAATESRIRWAGFEPDDFELYTTYENIGLSKPNIAYYKEIIKRLGVSAEECLMVGNDVDEDMIAASLGMRVFLLTDHIINRHSGDISSYPHGDADKLREYIISCAE